MISPPKYVMTRATFVMTAHLPKRYCKQLRFVAARVRCSGFSAKAVHNHDALEPQELIGADIKE